MTKYLYGLILLLGFSFNTSFTSAEIYRWVDEQGNIHFSDSKHADTQAEDISS